MSKIKDLTDSKWAIMVLFDAEHDDWLFVTQDTQDPFDIRPVLFDDINDALDFARSWALEGKEQNVKVVTYHED